MLAVFLRDNFIKPFLDIIEIDQALLKFLANKHFTLVTMINPSL